MTIVNDYFEVEDFMEEIVLFQLLRLVRLQLGIVVFIGLLSLDVWKAWKSKAIWVPQGALVLSAFSIQLLDILDTQTVSISDYRVSQEIDLERVLRNELLVDGGRVMVCIYMGYLLPQMARSASKALVWNDIGALALSVFTHIFSELFVFIELYMTPSQEDGAPTPGQVIIPVNRLSIVSRVCTLVCVVLLFSLLSSAVFAGKTLHNIVLEKIPLALKEEPVDYEPDTVERDVLWSWVVAWVCKPDYVITRSVLASSVGVVVTASVGCYAAEWTTQDYKVLHSKDGIDWLRYTVTAFMALLILMGWSIIFLRWMFAIFYFPRKYEKLNQVYSHVEDFWIRHIFEVMDDIEFPRPSWDQHVSGGGFLDNLKLRVLRALKAHKLLRRPLLCLQRAVILFSKFCCFLSENCLFVSRTRSCIVGTQDRYFDRHIEALKMLKMPGETEHFLLDGSVKAIKQTKDFMEKGREEGNRSNRFIELLRKHSTDQNSNGKLFLGALREKLKENPLFDYLSKLSWKMTALSLIQVIILLEDVEADDVLGAYSEAYDFLDLLDNPAGTDKHFPPELYVRAADKHFMVLKQRLDTNRAPSSGEARQSVTTLRQNAAWKLDSSNTDDSVDWMALAVNNTLDKVCTIILQNDILPGAPLMDKARRLLAEMLAIALREEVGKELVKKSRSWAETLKDEKIKASVYIAGKLSGVLLEVSRDIQSEGGPSVIK